MVGQRGREQSERAGTLNHDGFPGVHLADALKGVHDGAQRAAGRRRPRGVDLVGHSHPPRIGEHIAVFGEPAHQIRWPLAIGEHVVLAVGAQGGLVVEPAVIALAARGVGEANPVADRQRCSERVPLGALTEGDDAPDHLVARDDRQLQRLAAAEGSVPQVQVGPAHRGRFNPHQQRVGFEVLRYRELSDFQRFAVLGSAPPPGWSWGYRRWLS